MNLKNLLHPALFCWMLFTSCQPAARLLYGVKKPVPEDTGQLALKQQLWFHQSWPIVTLKQEAFFRKPAFHVPDIWVFDSLGRYIPYRDSARINCNGPAELFLAGLDPEHQYYTDDSLTLERFENMLAIADCHPYQPDEQDTTFFHVFFSWACWTGMRIYREKTWLWIDALNSNPRAKARIVLVNMDLQSCWEVNSRQVADSMKTW